MANFTPQEIEEMLREFFNVVGKRQYTGARYVPIFGRKGESSITWNNSAPYEPLTIVLYQGNSFTSRTYVPAGVDILDTHYWANTGNYNAQVEAYRQEVIQLQEDWDEWKVDTIEDLEEAIAPVTAIIPSSAFTNENTVKDYIDQRGLFAGANVMCVTDSWGSEGVYGVTKCWMRLVCEALHANYIDLHQGSTGFLRAPTFLTRIQNYVAANPDMVKKINAIIVCGGNNDVTWTNTEIRDAIKNTMNYIISTFTNATIFYVPQISGIDMFKCSVASNDYNAWVKSAYPSYVNIVNDYAWTRNCIIVTNLQYALVGKPDTWMNADFIHPTQVAHNHLAHLFISNMLGYYRARTVIPIDTTKILDNNDNEIAINSAYSYCVLDNDGTLTFNIRCGMTISDLTGLTALRIPIPYVVGINSQAFATNNGIATLKTGTKTTAIVPSMNLTSNKTLGPSETSTSTTYVNIPLWTNDIETGTWLLACSITLYPMFG